MRGLFAWLAAATLLMGSASARAQLALPTDEIKPVFASPNGGILCPKDLVHPEATRTFDRGSLLGQLSLAYSLNAFALPPVPAETKLAPTTEAGKFAGWIIAYRLGVARDARIPEKQWQALGRISRDLSDYLAWLAAHPKDQPYNVAPGTVFPDMRISANRAELLKLFFGTLVQPENSAAPLLLCAPPASTGPETAPNTGTGTREPRAGSGIAIALRGKIDDLAAARIDTEGAKTPAYKAASSATIALTDDYEKGQSSVAIDATVGVGITPKSSQNAFYLFAHYSQSTSETRAAGDDDDSKDIRALSPGIFYRMPATIPLGKNLQILGTFGVVAYPTFDFAQHARTGRVRILLDDVVLNLPRGHICGGENGTPDIFVICHAQAFVESAHVWRAGSSSDLASLDDDEYLGFGGDLQLGLSIPGIPALKPFSLTGEYRYMAVVSGALADPHRLSVGVGYKLTDSDLSLGLTYTVGSNFETFQRERITKITIGYKY